jgi:threonine/homoserine/homoserine lactone efflux protein
VIALPTLLLFAAASVLLALTPGPNWLYLLSRTMCQGTRAGFVSLAGTMSGVTVHMLAGGVSRWFADRPLWLKMQRWVLGGAFGVLAAWLAFDTRRT